MRVFKTRPFAKFCAKSGISDLRLLKAVDDAERGLIDADLGGGVIKQRIAREAGGKSSGFRTIILYRTAERAIFVHGYAKSDQGNLATGDLPVFRLLAADMFALDDAALNAAVAMGKLEELFGT